MLEEKTQPIFPDVIALPPLKMVLVFAREERMNGTVPAPVTRKAALKSAAQEEHIEAQDLMKIIEHLEKKP